jgi:hypothetical protein
LQQQQQQQQQQACVPLFSAYGRVEPRSAYGRAAAAGGVNGLALFGGGQGRESTVVEEAAHVPAFRRQRGHVY